jgi:hypothetical protein
MIIINSIVSWFIKKRIHQIDLFRKYPIEVQNEWFEKLISSAKNTEWGLQYDYQSIETIRQFKERVPVQDYENLKHYVERIKKGEQNLLWPSEIKWFAKSSGTTNDKSKFIPISSESLEECHYKGGTDMLSIYYNNFPDSKVFSGKSLMMGGSQRINELNEEQSYGDLSAIIMHNMPAWAQFFRSPDLSVALMENWDQKLEKMAEITSKENITNIAGVPSWTLVLAKKILEKTGKKNLLEVWPNLELFMHGGVSFTPYREQFKQLIPSDNMHYLETYNASEGFFGIEDIPGSGDLLLMLDYGIFYEFMPLSELGKEFPKTLQLDEVELNTPYALVISTNGGLWRYIIGDAIKFTHLYPFRIRITGRTKHFINAFGEELMIENADKAIAEACKQTNASINDYTAAPIYMTEGSGGHEWLIEFEKEPDSLEIFKNILDSELKRINSDYEAKRYNNYILKEPLIISAPKNTFKNWLKHKGKLGGQNKVPRLSNNREYIDDLKKFIN